MSDIQPLSPPSDISPIRDAVTPPSVPEQSPQRSRTLPMPLLMVASLVLVALVAGLGGWYVGMKGWLGRGAVAVPIVPAASSSPMASPQPDTDTPGEIPPGVACTMDAMQCPDGRWVGRSGPNCEFVCAAGVIEPMMAPDLDSPVSTTAPAPVFSNTPYTR